jgi:hypothetical protein
MYSTPKLTCCQSVRRQFERACAKMAHPTAPRDNEQRNALQGIDSSEHRVVRPQSAEAILRQAGCWYKPITFPDGSRNLAVISGASAPMGCTISPPLATMASSVAATLSTMM